MARDFPDLKVHDELRCWHLNIVYQELRRWRRARGAGLVEVVGADGSSPPVIVGHAFAALVPAELTATLATGTKSSPTSAAATLLVPTGTGAALTTTGGTSITVYNTMKMSSSLTSGMQIQVYIFNGLYYLHQSECP
jgi:hypothetical protein